MWSLATKRQNKRLLFLRTQWYTFTSQPWSSFGGQEWPQSFVGAFSIRNQTDSRHGSSHIAYYRYNLTNTCTEVRVNDRSSSILSWSLGLTNNFFALRNCFLLHSFHLGEGLSVHYTSFLHWQGVEEGCIGHVGLTEAGIAISQALTPFLSSKGNGKTKANHHLVSWRLVYS